LEPCFLTLAEVLEIHNDQIKRYGGSPGIRDIELLQSAIGQPSAGFSGGYLHEDIYAMAAAYLYHIVRNHPFIDGNKRTGAVAAVVFLALNGIKIIADEDDFELIVRNVAEGSIGKPDVAEFFRKHSKPPS
jgi:death-on-curing protein